MIGYCLKDQGKSHFEYYTVGDISTEELEHAKSLYTVLAADYEQNKIIIAKAGIFKAAYKHWVAHVRPAEVSFRSVLLHMMRSGMYVPAAQWIMNPNGRGLDPDRAETMWLCIHNPAQMQMADLNALFFASFQGTYFGPSLTFPDIDEADFDMRVRVVATIQSFVSLSHSSRQERPLVYTDNETDSNYTPQDIIQLEEARNEADAAERDLNYHLFGGSSEE